LKGGNVQILVYHKRRTVPQLASVEYPFISLYQDAWDDFGWRVRFLATIHVTEDDEIDLGAVRIATRDEGFRVQDMPVVLDKLPRLSASLGESIAYYRRIGAMALSMRKKYLLVMQDIVAKPKRRDRIGNGSLWENSFMREAASRHALKRGGFYVDAAYERIDAPSFEFSMRVPGASLAHEVNVDYSEHNGLPNRTIAWVGRNGTGKTTALAALAVGMMPPQVFSKSSTINLPKASVESGVEISRLITISYNVFDEFPLPRPGSEKAPRIDGVAYKSRASYKYCGLRNDKGVVNTDEVKEMLDQALEPVVHGDRIDILRKALETLLGSPVANDLTSDDDDERAAAIRKLSAGQRLVAAIFSNIIGFIEEGSLLLIDEPETNLHPGLLSTFMAALNETLDEFDSYAIVATHSPIVLQQVPSRYVREFVRTNSNKPKVRALRFECFGEDLGEITRNVLDLADPERDFTHVLKKLFVEHGTAEQVADLFDGHLGVPAMAYLYALEEDSEGLEAGL
jgi:predicted ATPase